MFGTIRKIKEDIEQLKNKVERLERKNLCDSGNHVWECDYEIRTPEVGFMSLIVKDSSRPFIRCKHCYIRKEQKQD